ncbi:M42 glutamyl aminopeptidase superfamily [Synechococcus sp. PCC 7335]|uniref:peptidase M42 n=1 Tax=Synechococcus sp. (strain ATCC 29403 / PCC 7335) TaxID=91464 RepID=UPI00017EDCB1|nr:peptidase M42 [Synechococcus sp. PCC 7335]EDX85174.1 M42 glutamyl aminopeptidase superfamily [Synechococcus sp. PCC 7335]
MNDSTPSQSANSGSPHAKEVRPFDSVLDRDPWNDDHFFDTISELVMLHSPSGVEDEVNDYLLARLSGLGVEHWQDEADNIVVRLAAEVEGDVPLSVPSLVITGHKDEIGGIVKGLEHDGRISVRALGGAYPWVYGEGVVDLLGDRATVSGILSFGSRHVSHESPQKRLQAGKAVEWPLAWVETKLSPGELRAAGVRPGTRMVIGKHRKRPFRMGDHIASYTLDNKASLAILLALAEQVKSPPIDVYLVASAKEEVGAVGALYFTQRHQFDQMISLEICPLSKEYPLIDSPTPALFSQDSYGLYDEGLNREIMAAAGRMDLPLQVATIDGFGSDASIAMKFGHVARGACLAFPTENTHGYEIAHLSAIRNCYQVLKSVIAGSNR